MNIHTGVEGGSTQEALGYDYTVDCTGYKFTGPKLYMKGQGLETCLEPRTGQIQVNSFCQVTQVHPLLDDKPQEFNILRTDASDQNEDT